MERRECRHRHVQVEGCAVKARQFVLVVIFSLVASAANAVTLEVTDEHGGLLPFYQMEWASLAAQKPKVRVVGPCVSACTVLLGYIPSDDLCVTPDAAF